MAEIVGTITLAAKVTTNDQNGAVESAELMVFTGSGIQKTQQSTGVVRTGPTAVVDLAQYVAEKLGE